jgi:hypothetical protein
MLSQGLYTDENLGGHQKVLDEGVGLKKDEQGKRDVLSE